MPQTLTLLNGVNETLKRVGLIQGDAGELTTFSDSARQTDIDVMIQSWNEVIADLYFPKVRPQEVGEGTITLVTSTREYSLATDFEGFVTNPTDETNGQRIYPYPGDYVQMTEDQLQPGNYTGQPAYFVINPQNGNLRLDTTPTADENGDVYTYRYTKSLNKSATTDTFPFSDEVVRALYPAVVQTWNRERKEVFDAGKYNRAMAVASRTLNPHEARRTY